MSKKPRVVASFDVKLKIYEALKAELEAVPGTDLWRYKDPNMTDRELGERFGAESTAVVFVRNAKFGNLQPPRKLGAVPVEAEARIAELERWILLHNKFHAEYHAQAWAEFLKSEGL